MSIGTLVATAQQAKTLLAAFTLAASLNTTFTLDASLNTSATTPFPASVSLYVNALTTDDDEILLDDTGLFYLTWE